MAVAQNEGNASCLAMKLSVSKSTSYRRLSYSKLVCYLLRSSLKPKCFIVLQSIYIQLGSQKLFDLYMQANLFQLTSAFENAVFHKTTKFHAHEKKKDFTECNKI